MGLSQGKNIPKVCQFIFNLFSSGNEAFVSSSWDRERTRVFWVLQLILAKSGQEARRDQQQTAAERQPPLPYEGKARASMYAFLDLQESSQHPQVQGETSDKCLCLFRQQNQSVVRHVCNKVALINPRSWGSSLMRVAVWRPCLWRACPLLTLWLTACIHNSCWSSGCVIRPLQEWCSSSE